jgi:hypothetical protein
MPRELGFRQDLCADINGCRLHAVVHRGADDCKALHCFITRPALANERVQCNAAGQVVLKPKAPGHDGTTRLVTSPLDSTPLRIGLPLSGRQVYWPQVSSGSVSIGPYSNGQSGS